MVTRIRKLLEYKQLTSTQFADFIGVGRPVMSHILSERNKPSLEVVQRIINAFPELSLPWLLNGSGEMLADIASPAPVATPLPATSAMPDPPVTPIEAIIATPTSTTPLAEPPVQPIERNMPAAVALAVPAPAQAPSPVASPAPEVPAPVGPTVFRTVRAPRFIPAKAAPVAPAAQESAPAIAAAQHALANAPTQELMPDLSVALPLGSAAPPSVPADAAMLPLLTGPGKAIRRIVIFYRDGSFADYQPEQ